jgi:polyhydroxybutyrate depolymerase
LPLAAAALAVLLMAAGARAESREVSLPDGRFYRIDLPARAASAPVILALHGGGGNPAQFARNAGLSAPATAQGYAVIYPAGTGRGPHLSWNGGYCCAYAARTGADDVGFLDRVVADAARRFGLDPAGVFVTGMSNGALMAERYAAERPGRVRAVAGVAGTLDPGIRLRGPVPLLHIHGTADRRVPYHGGRGEGPSVTDFAPVETVARAFRRANRAVGVAASRVVDPAADGMRVIEEDWRDGAGRVVVRLLTVEGGDHAWPGGTRARRDGGTRDISATDEVLRFFALHR